MERQKKTKPKTKPVDWKRFFAYYRPYRLMFAADLLVASLSAVIALVIPLIVRHITGTVIYYEPAQALAAVLRLAAIMAGLILLDFCCSYFITYWGHMMGATIERDMRHEIYEHLQ